MTGNTRHSNIQVLLYETWKIAPGIGETKINFLLLLKIPLVNIRTQNKEKLV
jgi:hypothetical protein